MEDASSTKETYNKHYFSNSAQIIKVSEQKEDPDRMESHVCTSTKWDTTLESQSLAKFEMLL